ncbi:glycoside hydrolase family 32 protein [Mucilaginibacter sp.]|uniref:glycoside hydrolase family 32 protein n=1 Tax=Mucilaginibacter sp. TaxID=1882438 RepID=UPI003266161A
MKKTYSVICIIALNAFVISAKAQVTAAKGNDTASYKEMYRPQYHLTSSRGALFDPTALVYVDGEYQVNRGVAKSTDLVHWKLGRAQRLGNDTFREMSGSAVIDSFNTSGFGVNGQAPMVAVYSGLKTDGTQFQCIAYSNDKGVTWALYQNNPVIDIGSTEFRDPQVFWYAPQKKWVMVVALAADRKIRFYSSANLKQWDFMSDFGPYGAVNGVWECPDLFRLPVKGSPGVFKWVLELSVQPISGQYFVGDFDGREFTADPEFKTRNNLPMPAGQVLFDFENGLKGWKTEGLAFAASPSKDLLHHQNAVLGFAGKALVNSFNNEDEGTGKITSPDFTINKKFLNFLIGGGLHANGACINLLVNGKVVRTKTGTDTEVLYWSGWDVSAYIGKKAHLEIVDNETGAFGHILIDHIMLGDQLATSSREQAFWVDYGPDFYAAHSWVNGPPYDNRRVSVAWLGSWLYATKVPTKPWKGGHTFPRALELKKTTDGFRLTQNPVAEIEKLHGKNYHLTNIPISGSANALKSIHVSQNAYEFITELAIGGKSVLELSLCGDNNQKTILKYNAKTQLLSLDRTASGVVNFSPGFPQTYQARLVPVKNRIRLHVLIDRSSIEVFGNDGEVNITCQIFPATTARQLSLRALSGKATIKNFNLWELSSIWNQK